MARKHVVVIPAAGGGSRMQSALPKQYLRLAGKTVLRHTAELFLREPGIDKVLLVISAGDQHFIPGEWPEIGSKLAVAPVGGDTRAASVCNGLRELQAELTADDWVLVHDAARPCLAAEDLQRLLLRLEDEPVGGIFAVPVADTLKLADAAQQVVKTVSRDNLWQAQTPQMFRFGLLMQALEAGVDGDITDEASAIERLGLHPLLVAGSRHNLKITYPGDLPFAEWILQQRDMA